jgi:hypothetical protein
LRQGERGMAAVDDVKVGCSKIVLLDRDVDRGGN